MQDWQSENIPYRRHGMKEIDSQWASANHDAEQCTVKNKNKPQNCQEKVCVTPKGEPWYSKG